MSCEKFIDELICQLNWNEILKSFTRYGFIWIKISYFSFFCRNHIKLKKRNIRILICYNFAEKYLNLLILHFKCTSGVRGLGFSSAMD